MNEGFDAEGDSDLREHPGDSFLERLFLSGTDIEPGADEAGDGIGGDHLHIDAVGMLIDKLEQLDAQDGDLFVYALD